MSYRKETADDLLNQVLRTAQKIQNDPIPTPSRRTVTGDGSHDKLILVTRSDTGYSSQSWSYSGNGNPLNQDRIKEYWDQDKYLLSISHTSRGWFFCAAKHPKWSFQTYNLFDSFPEAWIRDKMVTKNCRVTAITTGENKWMVVMTAGTDYIDQVIKYAEWNVIAEFIKEWWNNDYRITHMTFHNGKWAVVMSKMQFNGAQTYFSRSDVDELNDKIKEYWDKGYSVDLIEYGADSGYMCVMSKLEESVAEAYNINPDKEEIEGWIDEKWDKDQDIYYIGH